MPGHATRSVQRQDQAPVLDQYLSTVTHYEAQYAPTVAQYAPSVPRGPIDSDDESDTDTIIMELPPAIPEDLEQLSERVAMAYQIWDGIDPPADDGLDGEAVLSRMQAKCKDNSLVLSPLFTEMCRTSTCPICYNVYDDGSHYPMAMVPCNHDVCYTCCRRIMGEAIDICPICRSLPTNIVKVRSTATMMRTLLEEEEKNLELQLQKKKQNPDIPDVFKNFLRTRLDLARCQQTGFLETACNAAKEEFDLRAEIRSMQVKEEYDRLSQEIDVAFDHLLGMDNATLLREAQEIVKRIGAREFFHKSLPDILPEFNQANAIMNRMIQGSLLDDDAAIATREKYMASDLPEGCGIFNVHHFSPTSTKSLSELPEGVVQRMMQNIYTLNRMASRKVKRNTRRPARPKPATSH